MLELLSDPTIQFIIYVILGVVAIIVAIIIYRLQRQRKNLSYEIVYSASLSFKEDVKGKLQILYEGKPVEKARIILVSIVNSGNVPIESKDYERQINLSFGENAHVLSADVVRVEPENLYLSLTIEDNKVVLPSVLLNKGDRITIKILVNAYEGFYIDGRIVGVKEIVNAQFSHQFYITGILFVSAWIVIFIVLIIIQHEIIRYLHIYLEWWQDLLLLLIVLIPILFLLRWSIKNQRKYMSRLWKEFLTSNK